MADQTVMHLEGDFVTFLYGSGEALSIYLGDVTALAWNKKYIFLTPSTTKQFFVPRGRNLHHEELAELRNQWFSVKKRRLMYTFILRARGA